MSVILNGPNPSDADREHPSRDAGSLPDDTAQEQYGAYRLLSVLAEGGMGVVYLAEQSEPVRRRVALKVIKPGMDTREVIARFEAERQALAVMDHPNIATVFDGGASRSGRPYFVMEYVEGIPITEYCDRERLSLRQRLELFIPVCQAVQHAHQKGLIHRDIKPSNVLVTVQGDEAIPKVIDFGIAKAIDQRLSEDTVQTRTGYLLGTPAYMSPEQAEMSGLDIDTRTDVYSLGVLLYELLVGALPFQDEDLTGIAAILTVLEKEPPTLSSRYDGLGNRRNVIAALRGTDAAGLGRSLKGDLDWIALKAMEKDRARRYETANALAQDLRRYLADEPVLARAPSAAYRASKFVSRHKAAVTIAAVAVAGLIASSVAIAYMAIEANQARHVADQRRGQAEELISFMVGDLRQKLEPVGRLELLEDVGEKALDYFATLPADQLTDEELYRRSQALYQIGEVKLHQGNLEGAAPVFDESLKLAQNLAARDTQNLEWQFGLGQAYFWAGYVPYLKGDIDAAMGPFEAYRDIAERLAAADPTNLDWQAELAYAHSNIGSLRESKGDLQGALESFQSSLATKQLLVERDPDDLDRRKDLAQGHNTVAVILQKLGDLNGAREHFQADLAISESLVAQDSTNADWLQRLSIAHNYLGVLLEMTGDTDGALQNFSADLSIARRLQARDTSNAEWSVGLAASQLSHGLALLAAGDRQRAAAEIDASEQRLRALVVMDPNRTEWQQRLAKSRQAAGRARLALGDAPAARAEVEKAVAAERDLLDSAPQNEGVRLDLADSYCVLGDIESQMGDEDVAAEQWRAALALIEPLGETTRQLSLRATLLLHLDRLTEARQLLASLRQRGYRRADLVALSRSKGLEL